MKEISQETEALVLDSYDAYALGPVLLEKKIEKIYTLHIPHNTIYRILLQHDRVKPCMKKRKQRRWVRFEREHSMSLWQGDWKQIRISGELKWLIAFLATFVKVANLQFIQKCKRG